MPNQSLTCRADIYMKKHLCHCRIIYAAFCLVYLGWMIHVGDIKLYKSVKIVRN
jgi:hypothetical protein